MKKDSSRCVPVPPCTQAHQALTKGVPAAYPGGSVVDGMIVVPAEIREPRHDVRWYWAACELEDSGAEANNGAGEVGSCPNCMELPLRVGESFIADAARFAEATTYATDRGVHIVQEALGTYNDPVFVRQAID